MDAQKLQELRREVELAQKHGTTPDISAWDLFEVLNIAERAVSPAESVQSIDTPEFRVLLSAMSWESRTAPTDAFEAALTRVFAHIAAKIAAAHAEGRRSALEELHPQWLKEKERADRAEAAIAAAREEGARDKDGNHVDDLRGWLDEAKEQYEAQNVAFQACSLKLQQTEAALAARQAPDPTSLQRYDQHEEFLTRDDNGDYVKFADVQALLAQPSQQEGGKEVLANGWPKDFHEVVKGAEDDAYQLGRADGIEEAAQVCARDAAHNVIRAGAAAADRCAAAIRALAPHPSDKMQQVSDDQEFDRQAEAITAAILPPSEINPNATSVLDLFMSDIEPATSATDAGQAPTNEAFEALWEKHAGHPADFAADVLEQWGGWPTGILGQGGNAANLAQATPEGADKVK